MKKSVYSIAVMTAVIGSGATTASARADDLPIEGHAILRLENGFTIEQVVATYGAEVLDVLIGQSRPSYLIGLPPTLPDNEFLQQAVSDPRIKDAELDFTAAAPDPGTQSFFIPSAAIAFPNQPSRGRAGLNRPIGASPAKLGATAPVIVAVLDTGIDASHPMLQGRVDPNGVSLLFGDPSLADAGDNADNDFDGDIDELVGHGTMVASAIAFASPEAVILPIRILDSDGRSTAFRVAKGITEAVARGARVINLSLGTTAPTNVIDNALEDAAAAGVIVVASAGNDDANLKRYPAASPGVISVAGTGQDDVRAPFSTFGAHITISAPAIEFVGAFPGGWAESSGTSFAAPLVTGVCAGMLGIDPLLTPVQVRAVITGTAVPIDAMNPGYEGLLGAGRLDAEAAMNSLGGHAPYLQNDLNIDFAIDVSDLNLVLSNWLTVLPEGDADYSGFVNTDDLNGILSSWGLP